VLGHLQVNTFNNIREKTYTHLNSGGPVCGAGISHSNCEATPERIVVKFKVGGASHLETISFRMFVPYSSAAEDSDLKRCDTVSLNIAQCVERS
jgi:hypothetical protein